MPLRSCARTVGAICGNDMLERAEALVTELRIEPRWRADARQEAVLAELEGRDPKQAVQRFMRGERLGGMTGDTYRPDTLSLNDPSLDSRTATESAEDGLVRREEQQHRASIAGAVLMRLTPREQEIVRLRAMGWTQQEIAAHLRVSRPRITQLLAKIAVKSAA